MRGDERARGVEHLDDLAAEHRDAVDGLLEPDDPSRGRRPAAQHVEGAHGGPELPGEPGGVGAPRGAQVAVAGRRRPRAARGDLAGAAQVVDLDVRVGTRRGWGGERGLRGRDDAEGEGRREQRGTSSGTGHASLQRSNRNSRESLFVTCG
nr:hypothetical protein GCM10020241_37530 [Streptoalloteichus tenebrarius]